jgi:PAS domain-containing protein
MDEFIELTNILRNKDKAIVVWNATGETILVNQQALKMFGEVPAMMPVHEKPAKYGLFLADGSRLLHAEEIPLARALTGTEVNDYRLLLRSGAKELQIRVDAHPLRRGGKIIGAVAWCSEIVS